MKLNTRFRVVALQTLLVAIVMTVAFPKAGTAASREERLATQHFFCNTGYTQDACLKQIATLKNVVANAPTEALGEWTWVLVRSQDWKPLIKKVGLHQDSPAFTCLEKRTTFVEEALVAKVSGRAVGRAHFALAHGDDGAAQFGRGTRDGARAVLNDGRRQSQSCCRTAGAKPTAQLRGRNVRAPLQSVQFSS